MRSGQEQATGPGVRNRKASITLKIKTFVVSGNQVAAEDGAGPAPRSPRDARMQKDLTGQCLRELGNICLTFRSGREHIWALAGQVLHDPPQKAT